MALKALLLKKEIDTKRSAMAKLDRKEEFEKRSAELEDMIGKVTEESTQEERDAISAEIDKLEEDRNENKTAVGQLRDEIEKLEAELAEVEKENDVPDDLGSPEERKDDNMDGIITRDSKEYIAAYAEYVKGNMKAEECRALLTENVDGGSVPVPTFVNDTIITAWEKDELMSLVKKAYLRGNVEFGFEISGEDAVDHTEGGDAINEENLVLGIVAMKPAYVMKAVQVSKEVLSLGPREFLEYVYDELAHRIVKKWADKLIAKVEAAGTVSTTTAVGVPVITASSIEVGTIAEALGELSAEATRPVVIMNRKTWSAFKKAQYANKFNVDPFEGLPVKFNNNISSFAAATTGDTYAIVGDLAYGARANFPNGDNIEYELDKITYKKRGLVEVLGQELGALELVAPNAFVKVQK